MTDIAATFTVRFQNGTPKTLFKQPMCTAHTDKARETVNVESVDEIPPRKAWQGTIRCAVCMAERIGRDQCIDCGGALTHSRVVFFRRDDAGVLRSVPGAFQCLDCATSPKRPLKAL